MLKSIMWGICFGLLALPVHAQVLDSVEIQSTFWGIRYVQGRQQLSFKEVGSVLASVPVAYAWYKKAKTRYVVGSAAGVTGGVLIGYSVGSALTGSSPHWSIAAAGAGVLLVAIPFNNGFHRCIRQAVRRYNGKAVSGGTWSWQVAPCGAGLRLVVRF